MARYNGPRHYTKAQRKAYTALRAQHPEVYVTPGVGWCGPGWEQVTEAMRAIDAMA